MPSEKTLKRIVIILGILLVVGFAVVITTIIYRAANLAIDHNGAINAEGFSTNIPDGAQIIGGFRKDNTLAVHYKTSNGDEKVIVLDIKTGMLLGELEINDEN